MHVVSGGHTDGIAGKDCKWNVFRVCNTTRTEANAVSDLLFNKYGKKWHFITPDYAFGHWPRLYNRTIGVVGLQAVAIFVSRPSDLKLSSGILRRSMPIDAQSLGDGIGCLALCSPLGDFLAQFDLKPGPANLDPLGLGAGHSGLGAVADLLRLDLGQGRKQCEQDIADQLVVGSLRRLFRSGHQRDCRCGPRCCSGMAAGYGKLMNPSGTAWSFSRHGYRAAIGRCLTISARSSVTSKKNRSADPVPLTVPAPTPLDARCSR